MFDVGERFPCGEGCAESPHLVIAVLGRCEVELLSYGQARRAQCELVTFEVI